MICEWYMIEVFRTVNGPFDFGLLRFLSVHQYLSWNIFNYHVSYSQALLSHDRCCTNYYMHWKALCIFKTTILFIYYAVICDIFLTIMFILTALPEVLNTSTTETSMLSNIWTLSSLALYFHNEMSSITEIRRRG